MKVKEIITEDFQWSSHWDEEQGRKLSGMVKFNNGLFKSAKQAKFMLGDRGPFAHNLRNDYDKLKEWFGVDAEEGQSVAQVSGTMRWAQYGQRSLRPVTWMYVLDKYGVVRQYKLGYVGNMRDGTRPDPKKTKLLWQRPADANVGELDDMEAADTKAAEEKAAYKAANPTKHVAEEGTRMELDLKVKNVMYRGESQWGPTYMTIAEDKDGNLFFYTGGRALANAKKGDDIQIKATITKHITTKNGEAANVIKRPAVRKK